MSYKAMYRALMFFAVVMVLAAMCQSPKAHEFYSALCCNDQDCHPLEDGEVKETPEGYYVPKIGITIPYDDERIKYSPDGRFHGCDAEIYEPLMGRVMPTYRCLYVPPRGF